MQFSLGNSRKQAATSALFILFLLAVFLPQPAPANESPAREVKALYDRVEFREAIERGNALLSGAPLSPSDLMLVHQYLGFAHFNLGNLDSARVHFLSLLSLNPEIRFDPAETSPKIIQFFDQLRAEYRAIAAEPPLPAFTRYVLVPDLRTGAAWRSALLPGWGQLHKGQKTRAVLLGGAFWGSLAGTVAALVQESETRDRYAQATDPTEIARRYDTYNRWFKTRRILTVATAGLWLLNVLDASWSGGPQAELITHPDGTLTVSLNWKF